jgi:predicted transport protein
MKESFKESKRIIRDIANVGTPAIDEMKTEKKAIDVDMLD